MQCVTEITKNSQNYFYIKFDSCMLILVILPLVWSGIICAQSHKPIKHSPPDTNSLRGREGR